MANEPAMTDAPTPALELDVLLERLDEIAMLPLRPRLKHAVLEAMRRLGAIPPAAPAWQPIETAPRLEYVLTWNGRLRQVAQFHPAWNRWQFRGEEIAPAPTHWTPLLPSPVGSSPRPPGEPAS